MNLKNIVTVCDGSSITGGTEKVADEFLPAELQFEYVRFYKTSKP
jgi:hypothetical protein